MKTGKGKSVATEQVWAVLAGGGTAGHVFPGLAVAEELVGRGRGREAIYFATSKSGVGADAIQAAGYPHTALSGKGIKRSLHPKAVVSNLVAVGKLFWGTIQAIWLFRKLRPEVILCLGGYVTVSAAWAGRLLRIPIVVAEQNAVPGWANKVASRFAKACAVSFEGTPLPRAVHTGNPVRKEIAELAGSRSSVAQNGVFKVVILGGSLGAGAINKVVAESLEQLASISNIAITHITGAREWEEFAPLAERAANEGIPYSAEPFAHNMAELLSESQLVVGRAGAGIVAELSVMGVPSVLVPLPNAPGDHQTANAKALGKGAVVIEQGEFTSERLHQEIRCLVADSELLAEMSQAALATARPNAAAGVADLLEQHCLSGNKATKRS